MYLSQLILDPKHRQVRSEMANRYEMHRTLTACFPEKKRSEINLLFRLETAQHSGMVPPKLLVQSRLVPDWSHLIERCLLVEAPQTKSFNPNFQNGDRYVFRLLANPTVKRKQAGKTSKRVGIYDSKGQEAWLERKGTQAGFSVTALRITNQGILESRKRKNSHTFQIKHLAVQFDGLLEVSDPGALKLAVQNGIGSAKGFGFGLLSLGRAPTGSYEM